MGILLRFVGPLAIAPTITLVGVALFDVAAKQAGTFLIMSFHTAMPTTNQKVKYKTYVRFGCYFQLLN